MTFPSIFNVKRIKRKMNDCQYVYNFLTYYNNYKNININILKNVTILNQKDNFIVTAKLCVDNAKPINKL